MDGNGRWAESQGLERVEGHKAGIETVKVIVKACLQKKIPILSLFAFSSENWARPKAEVDFLMQLFLQVIHSEVEELHRQQVGLRFIGERGFLSPTLVQEMEKTEALTRDNQQLILNIALNYGGKWDVVQAAKQLALHVLEGTLRPEMIDESSITCLLSLHDLPDPDLFIRSSGEQRISNFFLWQLAYTELYFSDVYWPCFDEQEFEKALASFSERKRRFGQTNQQIKEGTDV